MCLQEFKHLCLGHFVSGEKDDQNFREAKQCVTTLLISAKQELSQEIENHSLKVSTFLAPFHRKLHSLPDWLQRDRPFHLVLRKSHYCLSFVICEMKGLCLAQGQTSCECYRLFFIVLLKVLYFQPFPIS